MKLWRIDATYEDDADDVAGMMTLFVIVGSVESETAWLRESGWDVDAYEDDSSVSNADQLVLLGNVWPTLRTENLVALAKRPTSDARRQLNNILARRKEIA